MKENEKSLVRILISLGFTTLAAILGYVLWVHYMDSPWTRDGRVRADVVDIAPDVAGLVEIVAVHDNQLVHKGDVLLVIDQEHYRNALVEAQSLVDERKAELKQKINEAQRRAKVDDRVVSKEAKEDAILNAESAKARYLESIAALDQAKLNLERTTIRSPADGWVSNLLVRPGDFAHVGAPVLAVIDQHSFWVYGYFEENKVDLMKVGDPVQIKLLGSGKTLLGHVDSFAHGIADRDNPIDQHLLANVNPSFNWVRLAQRIPVRIKLDNLPSNIVLVAGMTCSVIVKRPLNEQ
jgi:p-hydroxybenzoic acid efflux pump subunit AaeA